MKLKNNRGVTGVDVAIAVSILTLFVALIGTLFANTANTTRKIERKTKATNLAIEVIEGLKIAGFDNLTDTDIETMTVDKINQINSSNIIVPNGYKVIIVVDDYNDANVVKKVAVDVEYLDGKNTEKVNIETLLKNGNIVSGSTGSGEDESKTFPPVIESVSVDSKTTNSITIASIATDADEDDLTYMLYTGESSDSLELAETSAITPQGTEITLTKSSLKEYTDYYYRIDVTDGKSTTEGDVKSVRTYCPGGSITTESCDNCGGDGKVSGGSESCNCSGRTSSYSGKCSCGQSVSGTTYKCTKWGNTLGTEWSCSSCGRSKSYSPSTHVRATSTTCGTCGGEGSKTVTTYCDHNRTEQHDE